MSSTPAVPDSRCPHCGQPLPKSEEWKRRRFRWGISLAIITFLPFGVGFITNSIASISAAKTTGLGAVAGGVSQWIVTIGLLTIVTTSIAGITLLIRGYSSQDTQRAALSVIGILWFSYMLVVMVGGFLLLEFVVRPRMQ